MRGTPVEAWRQLHGGYSPLADQSPALPSYHQVYSCRSRPVYFRHSSQIIARPSTGSVRRSA